MRPERRLCILSSCYQHFDSAVLTDERHLIRVQSHIDRDGGSADAEAGKHRFKQRRRVPLHNRHTVSLLDPEGTQSLRQSTDPLIQLSVSETLFANLDSQAIAMEPTRFREKVTYVH